MSRRIAVLGLSGVGKSTLIGRIGATIPLLHLQASNLIKAEQIYRAQYPDSSETLRTGAVVDNQSLMIAAFHRAAGATELPIIFDGHSIIDGRNGLVEIPPTVFRDLGLDAICLLTADPATIVERRRRDVGRKRPYRDIVTLQFHQEAAEIAARRVAAEIQRPFVLLSGNKVETVRRLMFRPL